MQEILAYSCYRMAPRDMLPLIDLTSLSGDEEEREITSLCAKAVANRAAAVCVYPEWAGHCREYHPALKIVAVGQHFPRRKGAVSLEETLEAFPVDEVDMVVNLPLLRAGKMREIHGEIDYLARHCHERGGLLKVILESGELDGESLAAISRLSIDAGADFIKTSTGKTGLGATVEAAYIMLESIRQSGRPVGFKPSGGIRRHGDALPYLQLAYEILGEEAIHPRRFRLGASSLLERLLQ